MHISRLAVDVGASGALPEGGHIPTLRGADWVERTFLQESRLLADGEIPGEKLFFTAPSLLRHKGIPTNRDRTGQEADLPSPGCSTTSSEGRDTILSLGAEVQARG